MDLIVFSLASDGYPMIESGMEDVQFPVVLSLSVPDGKWVAETTTWHNPSEPWKDHFSPEAEFKVFGAPQEIPRYVTRCVTAGSEAFFGPKWNLAFVADYPFLIKQWQSIDGNFWFPVARRVEG